MRILFACFVLLMALPAMAQDTKATDQDGPKIAPIFELFDKFALVQVVGVQCAEHTDEELKQFTEKFAQVGALAEQEAAVENPSLGSAKFQEFLIKRREELRQAAEHFLADHGCDAPDARKMVQDFDTLRLAELPQPPK